MTKLISSYSCLGTYLFIGFSIVSLVNRSYSPLLLQLILTIILQNFKSVSDLVGFSVTVQTYWWLKVDGNHVILTGDIAPDERTLRVGFGRSSKSTVKIYTVTFLSALLI